VLDAGNAEYAMTPGVMPANPPRANTPPARPKKKKPPRSLSTPDREHLGQAPRPQTWPKNAARMGERMKGVQAACVSAVRALATTERRPPRSSGRPAGCAKVTRSEDGRRTPRLALHPRLRVRPGTPYDAHPGHRGSPACASSTPPTPPTCRSPRLPRSASRLNAPPASTLERQAPVFPLDPLHSTTRLL